MYQEIHDEGNAKTVPAFLPHLYKELLVLRLEGEREPVDDGAEDLEELPHAIEVLRLVDEPASQIKSIRYSAIRNMFYCTHFRKKLLICFLMNALSPRNLP